MRIQIRPDRFRIVIAGCLCGVLVASGCRKPESAAPPPLSTNTVAVVGDQAITVEGFQSELVRRGSSLGGSLNDPNQVRALLDDLIRFEVLYAQARKTGFADRAETQAAIKRLIVAQYRESLTASPASTAKVSEAGIEQHYRAHANLYGIPEQVRAALIFLPLSGKATPEKRAEVLQRAEAIRAQVLAAGGSASAFAALAQTNSAHQPTRYRGGDLGWLTRESAGGDWEPALVSALFELREPGQISPVLQSKDGLCLFRLTARKPASLRPLAEVRDSIAYQLTRQQGARRDEETYARLKAGVSIRINEAALARWLTNASPARTLPALPE